MKSAAFCVQYGCTALCPCHNTHMNKLLSGAVISAILFTPFISGAQTSADLAAQAEALLQKIQQLQQQLATGQGTRTAVDINVGNQPSFAPGVGCPLVGRTLKRGSSGEDVTRLQQFLARDISIYAEARVTGYYGALTEAAVQKWQAKYNIVSSGSPATTGYGVVGPRTAAAIALQCSTGGGTNAPVGGFMQITPTSGNAPLAVSVVATVNTANSCTGATYTLNWGDGSAPHLLNVPAGNCGPMQQTYQHTYIYGGTYVVKLGSGTHETSVSVVVSGPQQPNQPTQPGQTTGQAQISVSVTPAEVTQGSNASISWQSVNAPQGSRVRIEIYKSTDTVTELVGNNDNGIEQGSMLPVSGTVSWKVPSSGNACLADGGYVTCLTPGTYKIVAKLYSGNTCWGFCVPGESRTIHAVAQSGPLTIGGVAPTTYAPFSLAPSSGGNALAFTIQFPYTLRHGYALTWGDGATDKLDGSTTGSVTIATKSISHTYSQAGSYNLTLLRGPQSDTASVSINY